MTDRLTVPGFALLTFLFVACGGSDLADEDLPVEDDVPARTPRKAGPSGEQGGGDGVAPSTSGDAGNRIFGDAGSDSSRADASAPEGGKPAGSATPSPSPPPPANPPSVASCKLDTRSVYVQGGRKIESITAYGKYWSREVKADGTAIEAGGFPHSVVSDPKFATGICSGLTSCKLDSRTVFFDVGGAKTESTTAYGKSWQWTFDSQGTPIGAGGPGTALTSIAVFASGPCSYAGSGSCTFDTRTIDVAGPSKVETITAYGRSFEFTIAGGTRTQRGAFGATLESIPRFAGPCAAQPAGACVLDTRTLYVDLDGKRTEEITARNRLWVHKLSADDAVLSTPIDGAAIVSVPRLVGPCTHAMF